MNRNFDEAFKEEELDEEPIDEKLLDDELWEDDEAPTMMKGHDETFSVMKVECLEQVPFKTAEICKQMNQLWEEYWACPAEEREALRKKQKNDREPLLWWLIAALMRNFCSESDGQSSNQGNYKKRKVSINEGLKKNCWKDIWSDAYVKATQSPAWQKSWENPVRNPGPYTPPMAMAMLLARKKLITAMKASYREENYGSMAGLSKRDATAEELKETPWMEKRYNAAFTYSIDAPISKADADSADRMCNLGSTIPDKFEMVENKEDNILANALILDAAARVLDYQESLGPKRTEAMLLKTLKHKMCFTEHLAFCIHHEVLNGNNDNDWKAAMQKQYLESFAFVGSPINLAHVRMKDTVELGNGKTIEVDFKDSCFLPAAIPMDYFASIGQKTRDSMISDMRARYLELLKPLSAKYEQ